MIAAICVFATSFFRGWCDIIYCNQQFPNYVLYSYHIDELEFGMRDVDEEPCAVQVVEKQCDQISIFDYLRRLRYFYYWHNENVMLSILRNSRIARYRHFISIFLKDVYCSIPGYEVYFHTPNFQKQKTLALA
jgi:hypothetical protein